MAKTSEKFENIIDKLNILLQKISDENISIDESIKIYEEATNLMKKGDTILERLSEKVEKMSNEK